MSTATRVERLELSRLQAIRAFRRGPLELLERAGRAGDIVTLRTGRLSAWLFNHPDWVWHLLATRSRDVKRGRRWRRRRGCSGTACSRARASTTTASAA